MRNIGAVFLLVLLAAFGQAHGENLGTTARSLGLIDPREFGLKCNSTSDQTTAMQAALTAAGDRVTANGNNYGITVKLPANCRIRIIAGDLTISSPKVYVEGWGPTSSVFDFRPTVDNKTVLIVEKCRTHPTNCLLIQGGLRNFGITTDTGAGGTLTKNGIKLVDVSNYFLEDLFILLWEGGQAIRNSKGIWTQGRESLSVGNVHVYAAAPIFIDKNPNDILYSADHFHFQDLLLQANSSATPTGWNLEGYADTAPVVIAKSLVIPNLRFSGRQAWLGGKDAVLWDNTTCPAGAYGDVLNRQLVFEGVRWEQNYGTGGFAFNIKSNASCPILTFSGRNLDLSASAALGDIRNAEYIHLDSVIAEYTGGAIMNVQNAHTMRWTAVNTSPSAVAPTFVDAYMVKTYGQTSILQVLPSDALWTRQDTGYGGRKVVPRQNYTAHEWAYAGSVANNGTVELPCNADAGTPADGNYAQVCIVHLAASSASFTAGGSFVIGAYDGGADDGVLLMSDSSGGTLLSNVNAASKIGCYASVANTPLKQPILCFNRSGGALNFLITVDINRSRDY
jgi:hypothetical protein